MFIQYNNLDISFRMNSTSFRVLNIAKERLQRIIPNHIHGEGSYEIHYNSDGYGQVLINGTLFTLSPGSVYIVGPHVYHAQIPDADHTQTDYCIYLQSTAPEAADYTLMSTSYWCGTDRQHIEPLLVRLFEELLHQSPGYTIAVEALLKQLIVAMMRNCDTPSNDHFHPATPAEARGFIIEEAFLYEYSTITLELLADKLGFSTRQTERLLLTQYGKTFQQKRSEARMSAASILLTYTDHPIAKIAEELGYRSPEAFTTTFRKHFGVSAREYRRIHAVSILPQDNVLDPPDGLRSADIHRNA